jgi:AcrR family transcriptional regulator
LDKLDPERQRILFAAAAEEFAANGFDGASLNRILETTGMSKSSLYYYFDDKADLFATLVERSVSIVFTQLGVFDPDSLTAETFWPELERRYARALGIVSGHGWLVRFGGIFYQLRSDRAHAAPTSRLFAAAQRWVGIILARGQALGIIRTDLSDSLLITSTMGLLESLDRWTVEHWDELAAAQRDELPAVHIGLFRDLLARQPVRGR